MKPGASAVFLEPLGHNPVINLYRNRTPGERSEDEHPLLITDLRFAGERFASVRARFFHLTSLAALRIARPARVRALRAGLERLDQGLFTHFAPARSWAWIAVITRLEGRPVLRQPGRPALCHVGSAPSGRPPWPSAGAASVSEVRQHRSLEHGHDRHMPAELYSPRPSPKRPAMRARGCSYVPELPGRLVPRPDQRARGRARPRPDGRGDVTFLMTVAGITGYVMNLSVHEANANFSGLKRERIPTLGTNSLVFSLVLGVLAAGVAVAALAYAPFLAEDVPTGNLVLALLSIPAVMLQTYLVYLARGSYRFTVANLALLSAPTIALTANIGLADRRFALRDHRAGGLDRGQLDLGAHPDHAPRPHGRLLAPRPRPGQGIGHVRRQSHIGGMLATGNYRMDQWILGAVAGSRELGLYSIAVAWFEGLFLLPMAVASVARPDLVRAKGAEAGARVASLFRLTVALTLIAAVALVLLAPVLCTGVFGSDFSGSVEPLRLLAVGALGVSAAKLIGIALIAQQRPLLESASMGIGFVVALGLYLVLIPATAPTVPAGVVVDRLHGGGRDRRRLPGAALRRPAYGTGPAALGPAPAVRARPVGDALRGVCPGVTGSPEAWNSTGPSASSSQVL